MPKIDGFRYNRIVQIHMKPVDYFALELLTLFRDGASKADVIRDLLIQEAGKNNLLNDAQELARIFGQKKESDPEGIELATFLHDYGAYLREAGRDDLADRIEQHFTGKEPEGEKAA